MSCVTTGTTELVSKSTNGEQASIDSFYPSISADGRYIAFHSIASTLDPNAPAGNNVFVHDMQLGKTERIAIDQFDGVAYGYPSSPAISLSGRYVALRASIDQCHEWGKCLPDRVSSNSSSDSITQDDNKSLTSPSSE